MSSSTNGGRCVGCDCAPATSQPSCSKLWPTRSQTENTPLLSQAKAPTYHDAVPIEATTHKCEKNNLGRRGVCCRELKGEDERTLINPDVVRDIIIGLSDGLTVPFALTAGLSAVGTSRIVVIGGLAELVSGAISMGIGGYLASKAELDHYRFQVRTTRDRVARSCVGEMEREVREILEPYGVDPKLAEQVAAQLRQVENENASAGALPAPATSSKKPAEVEVDDERGLTPFLVRLGEGLEPVAPSRMYISALTIGLSYFLGGAIPLAPYVFVDNVRTALFVSVAVTGIVLLIFGSVKAFYTGAQVGLNGYFYGSFSTLGVGGLAAGAAWAIVRALESAE